MEETHQVNTKAVISLTMGILSVIVFPFIGWVFGLIGLVFGNRSLRQIENTKEIGYT